MKIGIQGLFSAALALSLVALTGCVDTAGTTVNVDHVDGVSEVLEDSVRLRRQMGVEVNSLNYDTVNGMKRVHITLANKKHKRIKLHYRISWFNENGMEVDPDTKPYRSLIIEGKDKVTVTGVANSLQAVRSKLRVRAAKEAM
ncbi:MAG: DUF1425 domain-containing protein [Kiritimatiellae bacterium]|nr:DUF1425 domain-containing protein [Kiritimatiellia bacterium]